MDGPVDTSPREDETPHRGGAWKVAYADFVTALMALFIVLWLMSSGREVREAVSGYFRDPQGFNRLTGSGHAGTGEGLAVDKVNVRNLRTRLERAMRDLPGFQKFSKYVEFVTTGEGLRIELMEKNGGMFFESGSPRPTPSGQQLFTLMAAQLGGLPNEIALEGHTDSRSYRERGSDAYGNWELSFDRANMARRIMLANGLRADQISENRGYADRSNLIPSDPADSRNRRVSIVLKYR
jgi:chemotaxis protein MotB